MTEDQTRVLDISDCASRMLEASSEFLALQAKCRELIALVQAESDLPVGLQSTYALTEGLSCKAARILGIASQRVSRAIALIAGKMLSLSTFVSSSGYLHRLLLPSPVALKVEIETIECPSKVDDDQHCSDGKEDNGLLEVY